MLPWTGQVCDVYQLRDLVLFVYSVQLQDQQYMFGLRSLLVDDKI